MTMDVMEVDIKEINCDPLCDFWVLLVHHQNNRMMYLRNRDTICILWLTCKLEVYQQTLKPQWNNISMKSDRYSLSNRYDRR